MLQRLNEENEHGWVKSIVAELFSGILTFQRQPRAMEVLVDALCLQGLPDHAVMSHILVGCLGLEDCMTPQTQQMSLKVLCATPAECRAIYSSARADYQERYGRCKGGRNIADSQRAAGNVTLFTVT